MPFENFRLGVSDMTTSAASDDAQMGRPRIFILEDSPLIGLDLAATAEDLGCEVIGPFQNLSPEVTEVALGGGVDVAIIDLVLTNGHSDRVIRQFQGRGVPVIICSGLMNKAVEQEYPGALVLGKPHSVDVLRSTLSQLLLPHAEPHSTPSIHSTGNR